jgi:hypothetical protein
MPTIERSVDKDKCIWPQPERCHNIHTVASHVTGISDRTNHPGHTDILKEPVLFARASFRDVQRLAVRPRMDAEAVVEGGHGAHGPAVLRCDWRRVMSYYSSYSPSCNTFLHAPCFQTRLNLVCVFRTPIARQNDRIMVPKILYRIEFRSFFPRNVSASEGTIRQYVASGVQHQPRMSPHCYNGA